MLIVRQLDIPVWDETVAEAAAAYLQSRRFKNARVLTGPTVTGKRGSWLGNLTSFDMTRLLASVRVAPRSGGVEVELSVNTVGQQITEWNQAVWRLEIVELYRAVSGRERLGEVWQRFNREARANAMYWTASLMTVGQHLSAGWSEELRSLEAELGVVTHKAKL